VLVDPGAALGHAGVERGGAVGGGPGSSHDPLERRSMFASVLLRREA
jgi:hypothetical protein